MTTQISNIKYQISNIPPWLSLGLKARLTSTSIHYTARFTKAERKILRKPKPIKVSEWAEKYRHVTKGPLPGPWRNRPTPYLVGIMDAAAFSSVETIIVCKIPQIGGSDVAANFIGYAIDRAPGDVLYVFPDEKTAKENSQDRLVPMIEMSSRLRSYMTGSDDDMAAVRIKLRHATIYLAWATSATRLANKPIRYLVFDETDKYVETAGKRETDPISLGEKRITTFRKTGKCKIWKISSPTMEGHYIWQAFTKEAEVVFDFWIKCPFCGTLQLMVFDREHFKWPENERDPEKVESQKLAWYECDNCHAKWDDDLRDSAARNGQWRARPWGWNEGNSEDWKKEKPGRELFSYLRKHRPKKIGFHMPAWISSFVSLSTSAAAFLKSLKDKTKLKDFYNGFAAEPWRIYAIERTEDAILKLRDDRPRGLVPGGGVVAGLTGAVDTHDNDFRFEIRAWGWGPTQDSWQIIEGTAPTFEALEEILFENTYKDADGKEYRVIFSVIDAMGGRTAEVYEWCRLHKGRIFPLKGERKIGQGGMVPYAFSKIETYPGTKKIIHGGIQLLRVNVTYYKNALSNKLEIVSGDPGSWRLHSETTRQWAIEMTAEYVDEKTGYWECPPGKANHAWDVSGYSLACADVRRIKLWTKSEEKPAKSEDPQDSIRNFKKLGWLPETKGWLNR